MIQEGYKKNFQTLLRAAGNDDACIMECTDKASGKPVIVVCAVVQDPNSNEYIITPLAKMFDGNPYEEVLPPTA